MSRNALEVHIEDLVLHGFTPGDRYRIGHAVERELARLFSELGAPPTLDHSIEETRIDAGAFGVAPDSKADAIGVQVAHAIYGGLSQ